MSIKTCADRANETGDLLAYAKNCERSIDELTARIAALEARQAMLVDVLNDAAESIEEWGNYADVYFQEKWNLAGDIQKYKDIANSTCTHTAAWLERKHVEWSLQFGCQCTACHIPHASDCAVHSMPAYQNGECNCHVSAIPSANTQCTGENCSCTDGVSHSSECIAQHEACYSKANLDTAGNRNPDYRYKGYKNERLVGHVSQDQRDAWVEGHKARICDQSANTQEDVE